MGFHPIIIGVTRAAKAVAGSPTPIPTVTPNPMGKHIPEEFRTKILARDKNTCRCCGFVSEKYQQIAFRDGNLLNLTPKNLITCCIFCHQCFHIDHVNEMKSGVLLWLPEISQAQLHHIARAIYVARIAKGPIAESAREVLDTLMERRKEAISRLTTDDPYILATVLNDYLLPNYYKMRSKKLAGIRLFPLDRRIIKESELEFNQFPQILAYWRSKNGPFGGKPPAQWLEIYQKIKADQKVS